MSTPTEAVETGKPPVDDACAGPAPSGCEGALEADLGWALGNVFRQYVRAADWAIDGLPGAHRGFQVLAVARREPRTQLALGAELGIDRTVMTYLLDDLEKGGLVERRPDPADRRARRVVLTDTGRVRLEQLEERMRRAEEHTLSGLAEAERPVFRSLLQKLATTADGPAGSPCDVVEELHAAPKGRRTSR